MVRAMQLVHRPEGDTRGCMHRQRPRGSRTRTAKAMSLLAGLWASALTSGLSLGLWIARGFRAALVSRDLELRAIVCGSCLFTVKRSVSSEFLNNTLTVCHTCMRSSAGAEASEEMWRKETTPTSGVGLAGKRSKPEAVHQDILGNTWERTSLSSTSGLEVLTALENLLAPPSED